MEVNLITNAASLQAADIDQNGRIRAADYNRIADNIMEANLINQATKIKNGGN